MSYILSLKEILTEKLGVDKSIAYSSGSRVVSGLAGVLSVFFISTYLTGVEQGFYFTFGSILALQVFFELGMTGIITQFVAHEASHLTLCNNIYFGDDYYKSRLSSLVHFCLKWYIVIAVLVFLVLLIVGFLFFSRFGNQSEVSWKVPWILICLGTAIKLFQSPFNSILLGIGKVKEMSEIGFYQQIVLPLSTWVGLVFGLKLYVVGIGYLLSVVVWQVYLQFNSLDRIIVGLWRTPRVCEVSYIKEIFPYQWKIAVSWISGYFIFQLFNPVLFATEGAVIAGQMGMTMHALNSVQAFSLSWLNTKVPLYSKFVALKNYKSLDSIFNKSLKQMVFVCFVLFVLFEFVILFLNYTNIRWADTVLADRFLGWLPTLIIMIPVFLNQFVGSWATYLRCHKQEPFLMNSVVMGVSCCLSTFILGKMYGLYGVITGYCLLTAFVSVPWGYWIYIKKKKEWHGKE